ncbi:MAG: TM2 domain-containing protein [Cyclobacteriaceae bacterium]
MNNRMYKLFPELANMDMQEMNYIQGLTKDMDDDTMETFAGIYRVQRKDQQTILILSLVGLLVIPGIQRFYLNQIGMGLLFLFTVGLCFIGSIIDLIKYKEMTLEYNVKIAQNIIAVIGGGKNQ